MRSIFLTLLLVSFSCSILGQAKFSFSDLVYRIDGKDLGSNEVPIYENINVGVKDISGYLVDDDFVELGMEVVLTDVNSNRLLYSPDMMKDIRLKVDEIEKVQFDIDLNEDFEQGKEYFIKIKIWDKKTSKSFSKHSSFVVGDPLRNENVYLDIRRLKLAGYKFFLNSFRVYKSNYIRLGDEFVVDLFFKKLDISLNEDVVILTTIIDEQNSKTHKIKNEYLIDDKTEDLKSVLVRTFIDDTGLVVGDSYILNIQLHNASRNQKLDLKYRFSLLSKNPSENGMKFGRFDFEAYQNKEGAKANTIAEIGDRFDFKVYGFDTKQRSDFGFGKIGGSLTVIDEQGKIVSKTGDIYDDLGSYVINPEIPVEFDYVVPSSLNAGEKYSLELKIWDKYSNVFLSKKFPIRMAKSKEMPFGLQENLFLKCKFMNSRVDPISVYVSKNGYKFFNNSYNVLDAIDLITSIKFAKEEKPDKLVRYIELYDEKDQLLTSDEEVIEDFTSGEIIASLVIPDAGIEFNRNYRLVAILRDGELELMKVQYTFYIEQ